MFKSRRRLEAENLFLRHQLNIALRRAPSHVRLSGGDRALLVLMTKLWPNLIGMARLVQPETILRWHRMGFGVFWRWKSRNRAGRSKIDRGLRDLIRRMSSENPPWGASRIHGELLMLGFVVAQSMVSKYMVRGRNPPSQSWKTFLRNHGEAIAAVDMCVVPTVNFELLFAFLVLGHGRRHLLWFEVTRRPTAEWLARQITEAFPWVSAPTTWCETTTAPMGSSSSAGSEPWVSATGQFPRAHLGKMGLRNVRSAPCAASASTKCWFLAKRTCGEFSPPMRHTTTKRARTWRCRRCSSISGGPAKRNHCRHTRSGGSSSSIRADMIFGKDRGAWMLARSSQNS